MPRFTIVYEKTASLSYPCAAKIDQGPNGIFVYKVGRTWAEAKQEAILEAQRLLNAESPPEPEEVDIE